MTDTAQERPESSSTPDSIKIYEEMIADIDLDEIASNFTCLLCLGIAINPVKCGTCNTVYCQTCLPTPGDGMNAYKCYKLCGDS